ncbi:MAG: sortase [Acidimicrobiales bacterium]|nr:sortase [Acidimicrobiales bacterium]
MSLSLSRVLGSVGRFFIGTGVVLLLFAGYQLWGTGIQEARAQNSLENEFDKLLEQADALGVDQTSPDLSNVTERTEPPPEELEELLDPTGPRFDPALAALYFPDGGEPLARIEIPAIGIEKIVLEGVHVEDLRQGPGHYSSTPAPGQAGNSSIAGHRTTYGQPFHNLDKLVSGDEIVVETVQGRFTYRVIPQAQQYWGDGEYCRALDQSRAQRLTEGLPAAAIESGLLPLNLPDDFAIGALDGITYFDTSEQSGDQGTPTRIDEPGQLGHFIVDPGSTCVIEDYNDNRITLTACHPKYTARQRIIVQAVLVGVPADAPPVARPAGGDEGLASEFPDENPVDQATTAPVPSTINTGDDEPPSSTTTPLAETASANTIAAAPTQTPPGPFGADAFATPADLDEGLGWSWQYLPYATLFGSLTMLIYVIGSYFALTWRRIPSWALMLLPVAIGLFLTFEQVDKILPAY